MLHIGHQRRIPRGGELVNGKVKRVFKTLIRSLVVVVGILGHDSHKQLVQCVFDALAVEGRHDDALFFRRGVDTNFVIAAGAVQALSIMGTSQLEPRRLIRLHCTMTIFFCSGLVVPDNGVPRDYESTSKVPGMML